jgi:hypothetical protein
LGIDNLTSEQAAGIFSGEIASWSQVGGPDQAIIVYIQERDDTMSQAVQDYILRDKSFSQSARFLTEERDVFSVVESVPGAISYAAWAGKLYWEFVLATKFIDPIMLDGLSPDDPDYSFVSPIGIAYLPERQADFQPIINWGHRFLSSEVAQAMLAQFGVQLAPVDSLAQ